MTWKMYHISKLLVQVLFGTRRRLPHLRRRVSQFRKIPNKQVKNPIANRDFAEPLPD